MIQNGDQGKVQAKLWINLAFNYKQNNKEKKNITKKHKKENETWRAKGMS